VKAATVDNSYISKERSYYFRPTVYYDSIDV